MADISESIKHHDIPAFAWDNSNFITFSIWSYLPCLPPFIIRSINDMENITKFEVQSLTWKATVFSLVIIKQSSTLKRKQINYWKRWNRGLQIAQDLFKLPVCSEMTAAFWKVRRRIMLNAISPPTHPQIVYSTVFTYNTFETFNEWEQTWPRAKLQYLAEASQEDISCNSINTLHRTNCTSV